MLLLSSTVFLSRARLPPSETYHCSLRKRMGEGHLLLHSEGGGSLRREGIETVANPPGLASGICYRNILPEPATGICYRNQLPASPPTAARPWVGETKRRAKCMFIIANGGGGPRTTCLPFLPLNLGRGATKTVELTQTFPVARSQQISGSA